MLLKKLIVLSAMLLSANMALAQESPDTIGVSNIYSTIILFPTNVIYTDQSNKQDITGFVADASKNVIVLQARHPFNTTCNVTAMESSGVLHTYVVRYEMYPKTLVIDEKHKVYDAKPETINISDIYSTHLVFSNEIQFPHLSNDRYVEAMVVPAAKNVFAIRAVQPFGPDPFDTFSISILETDGRIHTYIVNYEKNPASLILNYQDGERAKESGQSQMVSLVRKTDAPALDEVLSFPQGLYHIATRKNKISLVCENVFTYSDITYITLRLENRSGVSFEAGKTAFVRASKPRRKNSIVEDAPVIAKESIGTLTASPGQSVRKTYTFDKITLGQDQIFRICVYEAEGRREFFLDLSPKDINEAKNPFENKSYQ